MNCRREATRYAAVFSGLIWKLRVVASTVAAERLDAIRDDIDISGADRVGAAGLQHAPLGAQPVALGRAGHLHGEVECRQRPAAWQQRQAGGDRGDVAGGADDGRRELAGRPGEALVERQLDRDRTGRDFDDANGIFADEIQRGSESIDLGPGSAGPARQTMGSPPRVHSGRPHAGRRILAKHDGQRFRNILDRLAAAFDARRINEPSSAETASVDNRRASIFVKPSRTSARAITMRQAANASRPASAMRPIAAPIPAASSRSDSRRETLTSPSSRPAGGNRPASSMPRSCAPALAFPA